MHMTTITDKHAVASDCGTQLVNQNPWSVSLPK